MIYLDTNILIYLFEKHPKYGEKVADYISSLQKNNHFVCSTLTVTECLAQVTKVTLDTFLMMPKLSLAPLDQTSAEEAGRLQRETGLLIGDSVHLATALQQKSKLFFTNGRRLAAVARSYLPVKTLGDL